MAVRPPLAALRRLGESLAARRGEDYYVAVAEALCDALAVEHAMVAELVDAGGVPSARPLALVSHGAPQPLVTYPLEGTPCGLITSRAACVYPERVTESFPEDTVLVDMRVEAYVGAPLVGTEGEQIGLVSVLAGRALGPAESALAQTLLELVAGPAAGALERTRAEAEARLQRRHLEELFEGAPEAIALLDADDTVLAVNRQFERLFGYARADAVGRPINELVVPPYLKAQAVEWTRRVMAGERLQRESVRRRRDGTTIDVALTAAPFRVDDDAELRIYATYLDITERKRYEMALRYNEARFRSLIENASDGVALLDEKGMILYQSPSTERITGFRPEQRIGTSMLDRVDPDDAAMARAALEQLATRPGATIGFELRYEHKDGSTRVLQATARNLLHDPAVAAIVVNSRDVTESRRLEEQLRHAQKLEAVGQLAGGVAHDFNNILTSIIGVSHLLLERDDLAEQARDDVDEVYRAASRGVGLTRQLLAFSRKQVLKPRVLQLNDVVREMAGMLRRLLGESIRLELDLDPRTPRVHADAGQIEQVVMNLAVNARDAMPDGGRLLIRAAPDTMTGDDDEDPGRACALLEVADSGTGIRDDAMEHLFEPFFTTKEVGKGTGLGLATVYGIVTQSGGVVDVSSETGRGASFRVRLPAAPGGAAATPGASAGNGASARVLLVEDEPAVRGLVRRILQRHGYEVLEAEDGAAALQLVEAAPDLRLVVSDIVMPRMNGPELHKKLAELRPELPFLFISGYSHEELGDAGPPPDTAYLSKPFTPQQLLEEVGALIG